MMESDDKKWKGKRKQNFNFTLHCGKLILTPFHIINHFDYKKSKKTTYNRGNRLVLTVSIILFVILIYCAIIDFIHCYTGRGYAWIYDVANVPILGTALFCSTLTRLLAESF